MAAAASATAASAAAFAAAAIAAFACASFLAAKDLASAALRLADELTETSLSPSLMTLERSRDSSSSCSAPVTATMAISADDTEGVCIVVAGEGVPLIATAEVLLSLLSPS